MPSHQPTRPRARALAALAALGVTAGALALPSTAEAGLQTESAAIASSATEALGALVRYEDTRSPADRASFDDNLEAAADVIAADLQVSGDALLAEWEGASPLKQTAMLAAFTQLGVPYRSLSSKPGVGFDCSGLTSWAYRQAGLELPRISGDQIRAAERLDETEAEPGDLAYYPGHVSIYIGQGLMVHSPNSGNRVEVRPLPARSHRYGDAFTAELIGEGGLLDAVVDTTVPVPASGVVDVPVGRRFWGRYSG